MLLALTRGIGASTRAGIERAWRAQTYVELEGRTLAIVGLGAIGEQFAQRAANWGMRLIGINGHPETYVGVVEDVRGLSELLAVCEIADIVVDLLPSSTATDKVFGDAELSALGGGSSIWAAVPPLMSPRSLTVLSMGGSRRGT